MMTRFSITDIASCALILMSTVKAEDISECGTQPYYPSQYTCYDGFLCPVINGVATLKCSDACYLPEQYTCTDGTLSLTPPPTSNLFTLRAINTSPELEGKPVTACGQRFSVGPNATQSCTYCPEAIARTGVCASLLNTTILAGGSALWVGVPGGQAVYVDPIARPLPGVWGFTKAHSASQPNGSSVSFNLVTLPGGERVYTYSGPGTDPDGGHWVACPTSPGIWQVFAQIDGGEEAFSQAQCNELELEVVYVDAAGLGAWQFV